MPYLLFLGLILAIVQVLAWWRIFTRIGWPPPMAVFMAIPFVSVVALVYVALNPWPIEQRHESLQKDLKRLRGEM